MAVDYLVDRRTGIDSSQGAGFDQNDTRPNTEHNNVDEHWVPPIHDKFSQKPVEGRKHHGTSSDQRKDT